MLSIFCKCWNTGTLMKKTTHSSLDTLWSWTYAGRSTNIYSNQSSKLRRMDIQILFWLLLLLFKYWWGSLTLRWSTFWEFKYLNLSFSVVLINNRLTINKCKVVLRWKNIWKELNWFRLAQPFFTLLIRL